jgi:hypothetical protein
VNTGTPGAGGGGGGGPVTFTVTVALTLPPGPFATAVYVVVELGTTVTEPVAANVPRPFMVTDVACVAVQLRMLDAPLAIVLGCADKLMAGAETEVGG